MFTAQGSGAREYGLITASGIRFQHFDIAATARRRAHLARRENIARAGADSY